MNIAQYHNERRDRIDRRKRLILAKLREAGVKHVSVHFDGSGDSGSIESVNATRWDGQSGHMWSPEHIVDLQAITTTFPRENSWRGTLLEGTLTLDEAVESLVNDMLDDSGVDWYNNDGGYGDWDLNVEENSLDFQINVRYTESATEYATDTDEPFATPRE